MITVVSTGHVDSTAARICRASVKAQLGCEFEHVYIDCADGKPKLQNWWDAVSALPSDRIVALLDGDDWLAHNRALLRVEEEYSDPSVWLTYGQFQTVEGKPGFCARYPSDRYRREPWLASHLKTFRAGLFHRLSKDDLMLHADTWIPHAHDLVAMLPLLERASQEHSRFIPDVLYIYNHDPIREARTRGEEQACEWVIRARTPHARLESL